jgi:hypothetical protein
MRTILITLPNANDSYLRATIPKTHPFWLRQWKTLTSAKSWGFRRAHYTVRKQYVSSEFFWA